MHEKIECGIITCIHNGKEEVKYGYCTKDIVTLKWRAALDHPGKGTIVYVECLNCEFS